MAGKEDIPGMFLVMPTTMQGLLVLIVDLQDMFDTLEADVVVMQECKIQRKDLQDDMVLVPGWDVYFSLPKLKKGEHSQCSSVPRLWR